MHVPEIVNILQIALTHTHTHTHPLPLRVVKGRGEDVGEHAGVPSERHACRCVNAC